MTMLYGKLTKVQEGQSITGDLDFYAVDLNANIVPTADREDPAQIRDFYAQTRVLEKIVEVISMRAAPVIRSVLDEEGFSFAVEKKDALLVDELQTMIRELGEVDFSNDGTTKVDLSGTEVKQVVFKLHGTPVVEPTEPTGE